MKRKILNYWIDIGMAASFFTVLATGLLKYRRLIRWLAESNIYLPTYAITEIHKYAGAAIAVFVLVHLVLHWGWLRRTTRSIVKGSGQKK